VTATLNKWDVLDETGWNPHPKQEEIVASDSRFRVVAAGRRFGKSDVGGHELIPEAMLTYSQRNHLLDVQKRREFWIVGPEYSDSEKEFRVIWNALSRMEVPLDKPGSYYDPHGGNMHLSAWKGTFQVHAKSAKHPETLVGEGLSGAILAEAAKLKERVWTKYVRPTLADFGGWAFFSSTPEGKNWFYDLWKDGQDPLKRNWASWRCPSWFNPYVYKTPTSSKDVKKLQAMMKLRAFAHLGAEDIVEQYGLQINEEILDLMIDLTEESFNQEIGADFSEFVGRVFKGFDEEVHVGDFEYNPDWLTVAACDYGFTNPNVWLLIQVGHWGEIRVLDEFYEAGLTADEFAYAIRDKGLCPSSVRTFYPDPASPGDTRQMSNILKVLPSGGTGGEKKYRIDAIRKALKLRPATGNLPGSVWPQLMFDRKCKNSIREMQDYRYPERKTQREDNPIEDPMKKDDHVPEALGRFFAGHFGTPDRIAGSTRQRRSSLNQRREE
jgi:hypothetical protein